MQAKKECYLSNKNEDGLKLTKKKIGEYDYYEKMSGSVMLEKAFY